MAQVPTISGCSPRIVVKGLAIRRYHGSKSKSQSQKCIYLSFIVERHFLHFFILTGKSFIESSSMR